MGAEHRRPIVYSTLLTTPPTLTRWEQSIVDLRAQLEILPGDLLLAAAFVSHSAEPSPLPLPLHRHRSPLTAHLSPFPLPLTLTRFAPAMALSLKARLVHVEEQARTTSK